MIECFDSLNIVLVLLIWEGTVPMSQTQLLERILVEEYDGSEDLLLAELQFAFIAFLV